MSEERERSAVAADHRSALPRVPGIPWWGAILLGVTAAAVGFAYDAGSGHKELSAVFAFCYVAGCVLSVLAVRQSGVFTAVIQPPLILFVAVPGAYYLFHGSDVAGLKDLAINCGYPLIERFPLMSITSAVVLAIGIVRWIIGRSAASESDESEPIARRTARRRAAATATDETTTIDAVEDTPRRRRREHSVDRPSRAAAAAAPAPEEAPRRPRKTTRATPATGTSRSRHARPPETELGEPASRPRRRPSPPVEPPVEPRKRPRSAGPREPRRNLPPVESGGTPERSERWDRPLRGERPERYERPERPERRRRPTGYDPYEPSDGYEPRTTSSTSNGTHHPVSRVRYRGDDDAESRTEHRTRPRRSHASDADSWEYDV